MFEANLFEDETYHTKEAKLDRMKNELLYRSALEYKATAKIQEYLKGTRPMETKINNNILRKNERYIKELGFDSVRIQKEYERCFRKEGEFLKKIKKGEYSKDLVVSKNILNNLIDSSISPYLIGAGFIIWSFANGLKVQYDRKFQIGALFVCSYFFFRFMAIHKDAPFYFYKLPKLPPPLNQERLDIYSECFAFDIQGIHSFELLNLSNEFDNDYNIENSESDMLIKKWGIPGLTEIVADKLKEKAASMAEEAQKKNLEKNK